MRANRRQIPPGSCNGKILGSVSWRQSPVTFDNGVRCPLRPSLAHGLTAQPSSAIASTEGRKSIEREYYEHFRLDSILRTNRSGRARRPCERTKQERDTRGGCYQQVD